jgi:hypothetical protein
LQEGQFGHDFGAAGDAHLIVVLVEIAQFDPGIGLDLLRLVIHPQVSDVHREAIGPHRRHGANARLIAIDGRQVRKAVGTQNGQRQIAHLGGIERSRNRLGHR